VALSESHDVQVLAASLRDAKYLRRHLVALDQHIWRSPAHAAIWEQLSSAYKASGEVPGPAWWDERTAEIKDHEREPYADALRVLQSHEPDWAVLAGRSVVDTVSVVSLRDGIDEIDELLHGKAPDANAAIERMIELTYRVQSMRTGGDEDVNRDWYAGAQERMFAYDDLRGPQKPCFPWPWPTLGKWTRGGLPLGKFANFIGNTNSGKTKAGGGVGFCSLMRTRHPVVHVTTEDTVVETEAGYDAAYLRIDREALLSGQFDDGDPVAWMRKFREKKHELAGRLWVRALEPGSTVTHLRGLLVESRERFGDRPFLVILDMTDDLRSERRREAGHEDVSDVFTGLLGLTRDTRLAPFSLVGTHHAHRKSEGKMPGTGNVAGGYAAAQRPDLVVGLREVDPTEVSDLVPTGRRQALPQALELSLVKNRIGRHKNGRFRTACNLGTLEFLELVEKQDDGESEK